MSGQWCHHEFHILSANDEHTHVVTFEDSLCVSFSNKYKMKQMLGVSKVMTLDEYVGW